MLGILTMSKKLIIVIDEGRLGTDRMIWMADSVYSFDGDKKDSFQIEKHRYIVYNKDDKFEPEWLPDFILTNSYKKLCEYCKEPKINGETCVGCDQCIYGKNG